MDSNETGIHKIKDHGRPLTCPKGHSIYVMYFLDRKAFGFGCGTCKSFATEIQCDDKQLVIVPSDRVIPEALLAN